jgi:hypothetical protein
VPAIRLATLPAIQDAPAADGTFAKSASGLFTNDSSPSKENPTLRITRLMLAEIFSRRL